MRPPAKSGSGHGKRAHVGRLRKAGWKCIRSGPAGTQPPVSGNSTDSAKHSTRTASRNLRVGTRRVRARSPQAPRGRAASPGLRCFSAGLAAGFRAEPGPAAPGSAEDREERAPAPWPGKCAFPHAGYRHASCFTRSPQSPFSETGRGRCQPPRPSVSPQRRFIYESLAGEARIRAGI